MKLSPLQLERRVFTRVSVVASPGEAKANKANITTNVKCQQHIQERRKWMVTLSVKYGATQKSEPTPYEADVEIVGFFAVVESYPDEKAETLVKVNGPSVLYGAVREIIASITGRGPHPRVDLPTVIFLEEVPVEEVSKEGGAEVTRKASRKRSRKDRVSSHPRSK